MNQPSLYFDSTNRLEFIRQYYDRHMNRSRIHMLYEDSGFFNYGYWSENTPGPYQASENLVEVLLKRLPNHQGRILDVGCGEGATTRHLLRYYELDNVYAINISGQQLEQSRKRVPGGGFALMDAATIAFPDEFFDQLICVESAFHFETREQFLREAWRVLKPGGYLVLSDILFPMWVGQHTRFIPEANYVSDLNAYSSLYQRLGFDEIRVDDETPRTWHRFRRHIAKTAIDQYRNRTIDLRELAFVGLWLLLTLTIRRYLLAGARKPINCA